MDTPARLIAEEGAQKGLVLTLDEGEEWVIGRDPDSCELTVEDPSASRKHLILRVSPEGILLENLSETNPTQVNGENVEEPQLLSQGDAVKIGGGLFRFYAPTVDEDIHDTIFDEEETAQKGKNGLDVDFDLMGTGRWLLKVISGPNNGAEFSMHTSADYVIGTDTNQCDIVFHDNSISRQHARITIDDEDTVMIEDLGSRNGTLVDGKRIEAKTKLETNTLVSLGTSSFIVFDREGEMQTIISPLLPSMTTAMKPEEKEEPLQGPSSEIHEAAKLALQEQVIGPAKGKSTNAFGGFIVVGIITGLFVIAGIGTTMLFKGEPVVKEQQQDVDAVLERALSPFHDIRYQFNKNTGKLLLFGHVLTTNDKNQLEHNLEGLKFIKSVDDADVIIDEYVWREQNQIIAKNREWKGITVHSPSPGSFILSGYLKTRAQAEELSDYISSNFPYINLLDNRIIVEEDMINSLSILLRNQGFGGVSVEMSNGIITLTGSIPPERSQEFSKYVDEIKATPGIRNVKTFVSELAPERSVINISDTYQVSGESQIGKTLSVIINGRILTKGDTLDGMRITDISRNTIWLERDGVKYRIDY